MDRWIRACPRRCRTRRVQLPLLVATVLTIISTQQGGGPSVWAHQVAHAFRFHSQCTDRHSANGGRPSALPAHRKDEKGCRDSSTGCLATPPAGLAGSPLSPSALGERSLRDLRIEPVRRCRRATL